MCFFEQLNFFIFEDNSYLSSFDQFDIFPVILIQFIGVTQS